MKNVTLVNVFSYLNKVEEQINEIEIDAVLKKLTKRVVKQLLFDISESCGLNPDNRFDQIKFTGEALHYGSLLSFRERINVYRVLCFLNNNIELFYKDTKTKEQLHGVVVDTIGKMKEHFGLFFDYMSTQLHYRSFVIIGLVSGISDVSVPYPLLSHLFHEKHCLGCGDKFEFDFSLSPGFVAGKCKGCLLRTTLKIKPEELEVLYSEREKYKALVYSGSIVLPDYAKFLLVGENYVASNEHGVAKKSEDA